MCKCKGVFERKKEIKSVKMLTDRNNYALTHLAVSKRCTNSQTPKAFVSSSEA